MAFVEVARTEIVVATVVAPVAPAPKGAIAEVRFWNPATGTYQTSGPTILLGERAGVSVYGKNTGIARQNMYMAIRRTAPDGSQVESSTTTQVLEPGAGGIFELQWVCEQVGSYKGLLFLLGEVIA